MDNENLIKKVCKELGITQKELAERLDIPAGTISRWASTDEIPKTAKIALEYMLKNKELEKKLSEITLNNLKDCDSVIIETFNNENEIIEYIIPKNLIIGVQLHSNPIIFKITIYLKEPLENKKTLIVTYKNKKEGEKVYNKIKHILNSQ